MEREKLALAEAALRRAGSELRTAWTLLKHHGMEPVAKELADTVLDVEVEESLSAAHLRLASGTTIENLPWSECLARYDRPHTFFYADPPYWETEGYGVPFPWEEYERFAEAMRTCKGKVMLSINDHPDIRRCFAGFSMHELDIKYSVGNSQGAPKSSGELVITNYEPQMMGGLF